MARALIVGCGCRGRELGAELAGRGWQVRGTSRTDEGLTEIEAGALDGGGDDVRRQVVGSDSRKRAAIGPHRGPSGVDDQRFRHGR